MDKHCKTCNRTLPLMDFYGATTGRVSHKCKECTKFAVRSNRLVRLEEYRRRDRERDGRPDRVKARAEYQATERGKQASAIAKRRYVERNPAKRAAHMAVGNAIRDGKLAKQPCEVCGIERSQAHHDDYNKPLDVRWLCATHHAEHHKNIRQERAA